MTVSPEIIWTIAGVLLLFAEFLLPGLVVAFFGGGALITALTTWLGLSPGLQGQLVVFLLASLLLLILLRRTLKQVFLGKTQPDGELRDFNLEKGKLVTVVREIRPGEPGGKVRYQGTLWDAMASEAIPAGGTARIVGQENLTLEVEPHKKEA